MDPAQSFPQAQHFSQNPQSFPTTHDFIDNLVFNLNSSAPLPNGATNIPFHNPAPNVNTLLPTGPAKKRSSFTACAACQSKHCACDEQRYNY